MSDPAEDPIGTDDVLFGAILESLRWGPDPLVEPPDYPGEMWWLARSLDGPTSSLMACCPQGEPCTHHAAVARGEAGLEQHEMWSLRIPGWAVHQCSCAASGAPNGCAWCGVPQFNHCQRWHPCGGWHGWQVPSNRQRLARMRAARTERMATR